MIKILVITGLIIWISTTFGILFQDRFNIRNMRFTAPIGFAGLLSLLQLVYYPIQLFNLNSLYIHFLSLIVIVLLLVLSTYYIKRILKQFLSWDAVWLFLSLSLFLIVFYNSSIDLGFADGQMYLNYISQNISIEHLNNFNLWTGLEGNEFVTVYLFQGYYHFAGSFILMVNSFYKMLGIGSNIDNIVIIIWGFGTLYSLISAMLIIDMAYYIKTKNLTIKNILIFFSLFYTNFYYWKTAFAFYGNTWRSLFMAMMIFYFYRLIKESNNNYRFLISLIFGAALATSSSSLFIGFSVLLGIAYHYFKNNNNHAFEDSSIIGIPMVLYVLAVTYKDHPSIFRVLIIITVLYYGLFRTATLKKYLLYLNQFISKHVNLIFIGIIPIVAITYSFVDMFLLDPDYIWNLNHYFNNHANYDMVKNYLFLYSDWIDNSLNIMRWTGIAVLVLYYRKDKGNAYLINHFLILAVFFLNPLTTSFISKMFASNVYYRAFESLFNVFTEMILFAAVLNHFWNIKFARFALISTLLYIVFINHYESLILKEKSGQYGYYISTGQNLDPIYKLKPGELEAIRYFKEEIHDQLSNSKQITVVSHANGLRTFTPDVYVVFTPRQFYSAWDRIDQEFYQVARMWNGWEERPDAIDYSKSCDYLVEYNIDYVINEAWLNFEFNEAINECTTILFENYDYRVRKVSK